MSAPRSLAAGRLPNDEVRLASRPLGDGRFQIDLSIPGIHCGGCVARIEHALSDPPSPLAAIKSYFFQLADDSAKATGRKGCLLVNSALERAHRDKAVQARVKHHFDTIEGLLRDTLEEAQAAGEIPKEKDCAALASFMISPIWGLRVMSRTRPTADRTRSVVGQMLRLLE